MIGQAASFVLQAAYFVTLARVLGVSEYGSFAGAFALVSSITPYSTLGSGLVFLRYVSPERSNAQLYWGNALLITALASVLFAGILFFLGPVVTDQRNPFLFLTLTLANCLFAQIAAMGGQVFQALGNLRQTAILSLSANLFRLISLAVIALSLRRADAFEWSVGVLIASAAAAALAIGSVHRTIGPMRFSPELAIRRSLEGLGFSFAGSTQAIYDDIDKTILVHYGLNAENGFYTLAYRIVEFATTPIVAIDTAILPRHFVLGRSGISATTIKLVLKSLGAAAAAGTVAAGAILLFAPLIPRIVGRDFSGTLLALRWLCWIPLLRGVHRLTGVALTGSGNQRARTTAQFFVAIVNIVLNLWLIPIYGWVAAAWLSVASDGLLAVLNSSLLAWLWKTAPRRDMALTSAGMAQ